MRLLLSLAAVAALSLSAPILAGEAAIQADVKANVQVAPIPAGVKTITTAELKDLLAKKQVTVYDSRAKEAYDKAHVDGAVNLPLKEFDASKLPADKNAKIVFYCGGPACTLAPASAEKAKAAGYTNIAVYHEGIAGWTKAGEKKS